MPLDTLTDFCRFVAPVRERGLKLPYPQIITSVKAVAPVRERGLKFTFLVSTVIPFSRSRKGAWIEMILIQLPYYHLIVAPVRERGLKLYYTERESID